MQANNPTNTMGLFNVRGNVLFLFFLACLGYTFSQPAIAQSLEYMNFADARTLFHIKNFYNVTSNIPFAIVGMIGLRMLFAIDSDKRYHFRKPIEQVPYLFFFTGYFLTCFGSSYFHYNPSVDTLLWDRLPMVVVFMSIFSILLMERVSLKLGVKACFPLICIGLFSVFYWHYTESLGRGDLRFYFFIQFFPMLIIPFLLLLMRPNYTGTRYFVIALSTYMFAKALELADASIFHASSGFISGHTLKHLAAAGPGIAIILYLQRRRIRHH